MSGKVLSIEADNKWFYVEIATLQGPVRFKILSTGSFPKDPSIDSIKIIFFKSDDSLECGKCYTFTFEVKGKKLKLSKAVPNQSEEVFFSKVSLLLVLKEQKGIVGVKNINSNAFLWNIKVPLLCIQPDLVNWNKVYWSKINESVPTWSIEELEAMKCLFDGSECKNWNLLFKEERWAENWKFFLSRHMKASKNVEQMMSSNIQLEKQCKSEDLKLGIAFTQLSELVSKELEERALHFNLKSKFELCGGFTTFNPESSPYRIETMDEAIKRIALEKLDVELGHCEIKDFEGLFSTRIRYYIYEVGIDCVHPNNTIIKKCYITNILSIEEAKELFKDGNDIESQLILEMISNGNDLTTLFKGLNLNNQEQP